MQPARMKKIQSLDYTPPSCGSLESQQNTEQRALLHSVSIVVELSGAAATNGDQAATSGDVMSQFGSCGSSSSRGSTSGGSSMEETSPGVAAPGPPTGPTTSVIKSMVVGPLERLVRPTGAVCTPIVVTSDDDEQDDEDDEEDDDDDAAECLSSKLARRVVLVDEADKMLMRNRAQSAEPQLLHKILADFHTHRRPSATPSSRCTSASPPPPPAHTTTSRRPARHSVAAGQRNQGLGGVAAHLVGVGGGGGSELAEHGALSKLGMRRNTHHQVNCYAGAPTQTKISSSPSNIGNKTTLVMCTSPIVQQQQQLNYQQQSNYQHINPSTHTTTKLSLDNRKSQPLTPPTIHHRRQSLQISLLSGILSRDSGRSLTEEELRGEREFNEQVRCAARSPADLRVHQQLTSTCTSLSPTITGSSATTTISSWKRRSSHVPRADERCHSSTSSSTILRATGSDNNEPPVAQVKKNQLDLLSCPVAAGGTNRRRRVSFGAIDPIILGSDDQDEKQLGGESSVVSQENQSRKQKRASICNSLLDNNNNASQQLGILRRLERIAATTAARTTTTSISSDQNQSKSSSPIEHNPRIAASAETTKKEVNSNCAIISKKDNNNNNNQDNYQKTMDASQQQQKQRDVVRATASDPAACPRRARLASVGTPGEQNVATSTTISGCTPTKAQRKGSNDDEEMAAPTIPPKGRRQPSKSIAGPALIRNDDNHDNDPDHTDISRVQSIMANARLRQEEFARLLEEHEQIVNEINRFETKISTAAAGQQQQAELLKKQQQQQ